MSVKPVRAIVLSGQVPTSEPSAAETELSRTEFERVRKLIYARAGISLGPAKHSMVFSRLMRRLRALGLRGFKQYLDMLESEPDTANEWQEFVNALTTNLTSFFREQHHFPILAEFAAKQAAQGPVRIWCSAASTGEEPYSLAITMLEAFRGKTPPVSILATDIDTSVLAKAARGVYSDEVVARLDPGLLKRYFLRGRGDNAGFVTVRPEVRELVTFQPLNLLAPRWPFRARFHAIFCRNVMIYFDKPTQNGVLRKLAEWLEPEGLLFAGHSENFGHARDLFEFQGRTVYRLARTNSTRSHGATSPVAASGR